MKSLLKKLVIGTPLEALAREVYSLITLEPTNSSSPQADEKGRLYDLQTIEVMKRSLKPDSNCVDVGCHEGSILKDILRLAPHGSHFAFEPLPDLYAGLLASFGNLPSVRLYDFALSDATGTSSFQHVVSNPAYSGLRQRRYDRPNEYIQEITVKTERLDNLLSDGLPIHFIKIDVEGAELGVLKGAVQTIIRNRPVIVFEHGLGGADHYGTRPENIHDLLVSECGMRLFIMSDWLEHAGTISLTKEAFCSNFYNGDHYYFMAAP